MTCSPPSGVMSSALPQILARSRNGKIHSLFNQSFNIGFEEDLVHVGRAGGQLSSFGMILSSTEMDAILPNLTAGDLVKVQSTALIIYPTYGPVIQLDTARLRVVDLSLRPVMLTPQRLELVREALGQAQNEAQLGLTLNEQDWQYLNALVREDDRSEAFQRAARYLVGRGKGLTPSGDDILLGFFLIRKLFGQDAGLTQSLLDFAAQSTTAVSAAYLKNLANGSVSEYFQAFCQAVAQEDANGLRLTVVKIKTIGSTSGDDSLMGMTLAIQKLEGG